MLISKGVSIAGRPALDVRRIVRLMRNVAFSVRGPAEELQIQDDAARVLITDFVREGLVKRFEGSGTSRIAANEDVHAPPSLWCASLAGSALAQAHIGSPMTRAKAESLLAQLLEHVRQANADDQWLDTVAKAVLYGSLEQSDEPTVGDIDVAVWLAPRHERDEYLQLQREMM